MMNHAEPIFSAMCPDKMGELKVADRENALNPSFFEWRTTDSLSASRISKRRPSGRFLFVGRLKLVVSVGERED